MSKKFGIEKVVVVFLEGHRILVMEENSKVVVFEKKEIALILLFVVVLIVTSFTLGIRLGKKLGPQLSTSTTSLSDEKPLNLRSTLEEDAEVSVIKERELSDEEKLKRLMDESKSRLNNELNKFKEDDVSPQENAPQATAVSSPMAGKFTIQLGSYNTVDEARQFAEGFTVRGYSPILNEVVIPGKGKWYRVSLGLFDSAEEAKSYIRQEQSLFAGQDHIITEIK